MLKGKLRWDRVVFLGAILVACLYFVYLKNSLNGGFIAGADWNNPATKQQFSRSVELFSSTWSDSWYLGFRNSSHTNLWFVLFSYVLSRVISDLTLIPIFVIVLVQLLAFLTTHLFLRENKVSHAGSVAGGLFLVITPLFFNYISMGWFYVLFAFSFLNLSLVFIRKGLVENKLRHIMLAGVFYGMSFVQSQASLWVFIITSTYVLVCDFGKIPTRKKLLSIFLFLFVGLFFNTPTIMGTLLMPDGFLLDNEIVSSGVSAGTSVNAKPINLIRLMGSGFNSQYESAQQGNISIALSFVASLLLVLTILHFGSNGRLVKSFFLLFFVPILAFLIGRNREFMARIPGASIFRDISRFSFISTYVSAVLVGIFVELSLKMRGRKRAILIGLVTVCFISTLSPWIRGELVKQSSKEGPDVRLRGIDYSPEYFEVERLLEDTADVSRVLYLPPGPLSLENYQEFSGAYREFADVFSGYSPLPGSIYLSDRVLGSAGDTLSSIYSMLKSENFDNLINILRITSTKFVIVKTTSEFVYRWALLNYLDESVHSNTLTLRYGGSDIRVYEVISPYPLVYSPAVSDTHSEDAIGLAKLDLGNRNGTFIPTGFMNEREKLLDAEVIHSKISPTKVSVAVLNAGDHALLVFTDGYDEGWGLIESGKSILAAKNYRKYYTHFVANGYANGWYIDVASLCENEAICSMGDNGTYTFDVTLEYGMQKTFIVGTFISITILFGIALSYLVPFFKPRVVLERSSR